STGKFRLGRTSSISACPYPASKCWTGDAQRRSIRDGAPLRLVAKPQQRDKDPRESGECRRHEDERREPTAEHVLIEERTNIVRERRGEVGDRHQRRERKAF